MLRALVFAIFLVVGNFGTLVNAQDFAAIDKYAMNLKASGDLAAVTEQLVAPYTTELEKARAIFTYVASRVRYDCREYHREPKDRKARTQAEILARAFEKNLGVCAGYAFLFTAMCDAAGLESVVVGGTSRTGARRYNPSRLPENHAWNAVAIDGQWYLLDATWAAGFTDREVTKFTASFDGRLFMQDPEAFFLRHFPADPQWQLLPTPRTAEEFVNQPAMFRLPQTWQLTDFTPTAGLLPSGEKTFEFRIQLSGADKVFLTMGKKRYEMTQDETGYYHYALNRSEIRGRTVTLRALQGDRIRPVVEYRLGG